MAIVFGATHTDRQEQKTSWNFWAINNYNEASETPRCEVGGQGKVFHLWKTVGVREKEIL